MDKISVIIPTLNEAKTISSLIKELKELFNRVNMDYEIIVVDGGSSDGTVDLCENLGVKILFQKNRGYADAILTGLFNSSGEWLLTMDADFSHPVEFILELLKYRKQADVIIACRYIKKGFSYAGLLRKLVSRFICLLFRYGLCMPVRDITSGFRLYRREVIEALDRHSFRATEFEILVEILLEAYRIGYHFEEIPFVYTPRNQGKSHIPKKILRLLKGYLTIFYKYFKIRNSLKFADYDERAYYSLNPLQRYWQRKRYKIIMDFLEKDGSIVDLGCGSSKVIQNLPGAIAVDIVFDKLRFLRKSNRYLINADIVNLPFKNDTFYCVICSEVIEHIKGDNVFKELSRIIKSEGILIIGTPDYNRLLWRIIEFFYNFLGQGYKDRHISRYTDKSLKKILHNYGFKIITKKYIFGSELIIKAQKL